MCVRMKQKLSNYAENKWQLAAVKKIPASAALLGEPGRWSAFFRALFFSERVGAMCIWFCDTSEAGLENKSPI